MSKSGSSASEARRQAQALLGNRKEAARIQERDRERSAEDEKTARLRALRLAREAAQQAEKEASKQRFAPTRRSAPGGNG